MAYVINPDNCEAISFYFVVSQLPIIHSYGG